MRKARYYIFFIAMASLLSMGCGKKNGSGSGGTTPPPPPPPTPPVVTTCIPSGISQVNSGIKSESALTAYYNSSYDVTRIIIYDSSASVKKFDVDLNYITPDSVRIDAYQYLKLDAQKRVVLFVSRSDMKNPSTADEYKFEYIYNGQGYLESKNLFINGSKLPNFRTIYTYSNNQLIKCVMTAVSSGNLKVLESDLVYDNTINIKTWIYTFPDAFEGYMFYTALNFGNRPVNPLQQVTTRIYTPSTGALLDTWSTNYSGYKVDANGYLTYGIANGDLQQGIASFYGKTNFYYLCH